MILRIKVSKANQNHGLKLMMMDGSLVLIKNPFNFLNDRLLAGTTYMIRYEKGEDVIWVLST